MVNRLSFVGILLITACAPSRAQLPAPPPPVIADPTPAPAPTSAIHPGTISPVAIRTLPLNNRLTIKTVEDHGAKFCAVSLWFETPLWARKRLVAELAIRMVYNYVDLNTPSSVFFRRTIDIEGFGLTIWSTEKDASFALRALARGLRGAAFSVDIFHGQRVAFARDLVEDFRTVLGPTMLYRARYGADHEWSQDSLSLVNTLDKITLDDIRDFSATYMRPALATLATVARTSPATETETQSALAQWVGGGVAEKAGDPPIPPARAAGGIRFHVMGGKRELAYMLLMHTGPPRDHPDHAGFVGLCDAFGLMWLGVNAEFRHQSGATYGLRSFVVHRPQLSECFFGGYISPDRLLDVVHGHRDQIQALQQGTVDPELITRIDTLHEARQADRLEDPRLFAEQLARSHASEATSSAPVTPAQLSRVARRFLTTQRWDLAIFTGSRHLMTRLRRRGPVMTYRLMAPPNE